MPQQQIDDALAQLVSAELIFRRGSPPDAEYTFKHALVQDAAYSTLLRSRRQQIHARIAAVLEADFANTIPAEPELLARHLTDAGLLEKAVPWWLRAGERATERSTNLEANHSALDRGLGKLLDEQRYPVGAINNLVSDLLWQRLTAGHVCNHLDAVYRYCWAVSRKPRARRAGAAPPGRSYRADRGDRSRPGAAREAGG